MAEPATLPAPPPATPTPREWEPFDPGFCRDFVKRAVAPASDHWFRPQLLGAQRIPRHGPVILAANHSGTAFPYDGMILDAYLWRLDGLRAGAKFRTVYEKELSFRWWMRPFGLDNFWRRGGGVDMTFDNFDRLLARGDRVIYFPEGVPGIGKGFQNRYRLQRFSTSFVLLAARHGVPVIPLYILNAEWVMPYHFTLKPLDRLMQRVFHVPFLPLPAGILAIIFPWMWYLALPAHMIFVAGKTLDMAPLLASEGVTDLDRPDRAALQHVAMKVRHAMQAELDQLVQLHGRRPYRLRMLLRELWRARRRLGAILPIAWPATFLRSERDRLRPPARNRLHALLRDWDLIGFYLPLGWPLLSIFRALRRPPYGYRGMSREEARRKRGEFIWRLAERPLPDREKWTED